MPAILVELLEQVLAHFKHISKSEREGAIQLLEAHHKELTRKETMEERVAVRIRKIFGEGREGQGDNEGHEGDEGEGGNEGDEGHEGHEGQGGNEDDEGHEGQEDRGTRFPSPHPKSAPSHRRPRSRSYPPRKRGERERERKEREFTCKRTPRTLNVFCIVLLCFVCTMFNKLYNIFYSIV